MVKIKGKIKKWGSSYGILIPKALIQTEIFSENQEVTLELKEVVTNKSVNSDIYTLCFSPTLEWRNSGLFDKEVFLPLFSDN